MKKNALISFIQWILITLIILLIAYALHEVIFMRADVPTGSMEDTINTTVVENGRQHATTARIIGNKLSYAFGRKPKRGDIIIFYYPVDTSQIYIKRIIGLPGETVRIMHGKIYIDDDKTPLNETYLKEDWVTENDGYAFSVPANSYLCLGDNRNISLDARYWPDEAIKAQIATADDAMNYAYVPFDYIIAKAQWQYYPKFKKLYNTAHY